MLGGALAAMLLWAAVPVAATAGQATRSAECGDVWIFGARGSGDIGPGSDPTSRGWDADGYGTVVATVIGEVRRLRPGVDIRSAPARYAARATSLLIPSNAEKVALAVGPAAAPVPVIPAWALTSYGAKVQRYLSGLDGGVGIAYKEVVAHAAACPSERLVMIGYSQGAMLVHRLLNRLKDNGQAAILARIDAVALVADGDRLPNTPKYHLGSTKGKGNGITGFPWPTTSIRWGRPVPPAIAERTISVCDDKDLVCDFSPRLVFRYNEAAKIHTGYAAGPLLPAAAKFVADRLPAAPSGPGRVAWTWETSFPNGQVYLRGEGALTVDNRTLSPSRAVNVTYRTTSSSTTGGADQCWVNRAYDGISQYSMVLLRDGATVQAYDSAPLLGRLTFSGPLAATGCIQGGVQTEVISYAGPATLSIQPEDATVTTPLAVMPGWLNGYGDGVNQYVMTTTFHVAGDALQTTR